MRYNNSMEQKIKAYEKFIAREAGREMGAAERERLANFHREMVANFQHERLIHLIVTLFFAMLAIVFMFVTAYEIMWYGLAIEMIPLYFLTLILAVLTGFYVKHYYFLENHVQRLYKYNEKLHNSKKP